MIFAFAFALLLACCVCVYVGLCLVLHVALEIFQQPRGARRKAIGSVLESFCPCAFAFTLHGLLFELTMGINGDLPGLTPGIGIARA